MSKTKSDTKKLTAKQQQELLATLKDRFENNMSRHQGLTWDNVMARLVKAPAQLRALYAMEESGGEPDVVGQDKKSGEILFYDCSAESPRGRRSICYDQAALESRKKHKPTDSAMNMAESMGVALLTESQYRELQQLGEFDLKTSSWVQTPESIRTLGGALFCDRRYDHVFTCHNGAESYYAARGFRACLRV